ncbi:hypothetical protein G6011_08946 [Alternaria panax]|uniref:Uncharacterized protein n=1 Tax=Alternaria panax TaxID=48097 RepID=A0AAD4IA90_9PLEO|nr:hypothetical protein G6011_08946 [Alternaria panax]
MAPVSQLSKADIRLFLQQLQANPLDVTMWGPTMRLSLLRGGLIDFTIYGRRVSSAPRFALMAVSQIALAFLVKHPRAPAINFTFDVPAVNMGKERGQTKLINGKSKMSAAQIGVHEAALVAISQWLTTLCTLTLMPLDGTTFSVETCIRFICAHTLCAPEYVQHLTDKFVTGAVKLALSSHQVTELVKSCRGHDDVILIGLADKLIGKLLSDQVATTQLDNFLRTAENEPLRKTVETMEREMGFRTKDMSRVHEIKDDAEMDVEAGNIEVDASERQILLSASGGETSSKRQKTAHVKDCA